MDPEAQHHAIDPIEVRHNATDEIGQRLRAGSPFEQGLEATRLLESDLTLRVCQERRLVQTENVGGQKR